MYRSRKKCNFKILLVDFFMVYVLLLVYVYTFFNPQTKQLAFSFRWQCILLSFSMHTKMLVALQQCVIIDVYIRMFLIVSTFTHTYNT
jgi:hypothetical protein